jgi:hypothetical protein
VELNGAKSEPTHIYDPEHSLLFAWKELARHITYMYQISKVNHARMGISFLDYRQGTREILAHFRHLQILGSFSR